MQSGVLFKDMDGVRNPLHLLSVFSRLLLKQEQSTGTQAGYIAADIIRSLGFALLAECSFRTLRALYTIRPYSANPNRWLVGWLVGRPLLAEQDEDEHHDQQPIDMIINTTKGFGLQPKTYQKLCATCVPSRAYKSRPFYRSTRVCCTRVCLLG